MSDPHAPDQMRRVRDGVMKPHPTTVADAVRRLVNAIEYCDAHPDNLQAPDALDVAWADVYRLDEELADLRLAAGAPAVDE